MHMRPRVVNPRISQNLKLSPKLHSGAGAGVTAS
jgi:hypothetical protein